MATKAFDDTKWDEQFHNSKEALLEKPPIPYAVQGLFASGSLNMVYGHSGSLKSLVLVDMMVCKALGTQWLKADGFEGFCCARGNVLWIDADNGRDLTEERIGAALRGHATNLAQARETSIRYASFLSPAFLANDNGAVQALMHRIDKWKIEMMVLDNLGTISGTSDENTAQMVQVMNQLRYVAEKTGCVVNVVHHIAKTGDDKDRRRTPRGHSSIEASLDLALWAARDGDVFTATPTKQRRAPIESFSALLEYEQDTAGVRLHRFHFEGVEAEIDPTSLKVERIVREYLTKNKRANQSTLVEALRKGNVGRNFAVSEISRMVRKNLLRVASGTKKEKLFELPIRAHKG